MSELESLPDDIQALLHKAQGGAPPPPPGVEAVVLAKVTASVGAPLLAGIGITKVLLGVVAVAVVGTAALVVVPRLASSPPTEVAPVVAPVVIAPVEVAPVVIAPVEVAPVEVAPVEVAPPPPPSVNTGPSESALLESARTALERGDGDSALKKLQEHAARFTKGKLVEERRALTIVAFAQKGDSERALAAARAFEREYPASLFLQTVRAAVDDGLTK